MDLSIQNTYQIADDIVENVGALMECTDAQRLSFDEMSFGEFTTTNVPTLLKGSRATVNGALFGPAASDGVPLYIANAAGSTFQDVSAAPADTTLYLCLIASSMTAVTFALKACASVVFDAEKRGFYEAGTQNRVFGECRKVSGAWPVHYKRLYSRPDVSESLIKMYSDGVEVNARKLTPINNIGLVKADAVYSHAINSALGDAITTLFKIRVDYPLILEISVLGKTTTTYDGSSQTVSGNKLFATALDSDNATEIGPMPGVEFGVVSSKSAAATSKVCLPLPVGTFNIKLKSAIVTYYAYIGTVNTPFTASVYVNSISAYVRNVFGDRTGSWGAIL